MFRRTTIVSTVMIGGLVAGCGSAAESERLATSSAQTDSATAAAPQAPGMAQPVAQAEAGAPAGTASVVSTRSFDETVAAAVSAIEGNDAITLVANIDHSANADSVDLSLPPTTELIFGNPMLGTPLMQASARTGIDLPQKLLITEVNSIVTVTWNQSDYLAGRHSLTGVDEQLTTIDMALAGLARTAAGLPDDAPIEAASPSTVDANEGLVVSTTTGTAREAADRLLGAIEANDALILVAEVDHTANAASVDLELRPTIEVIFGNPNLGTPLMNESRSVAIDLPQKMLFVETDDGVEIVYNDPQYLASRHGIDSSTPELATISGALDMLATAAAADADDHNGDDDDDDGTTTSTTTTTTPGSGTPTVTIPATR